MILDLLALAYLYSPYADWRARHRSIWLTLVAANWMFLVLDAAFLELW